MLPPAVICKNQYWFHFERIPITLVSDINFLHMEVLLLALLGVVVSPLRHLDI